MPERYQHPFEEPLYYRTMHPVFVYKGLRFLAGFVEVVDHLADKPFVFARQTYFMLVAQTPVIKIGRANNKVFPV